MTVIEYKAISASSVQSLNTQAEKLIGQGYEPLGGISVFLERGLSGMSVLEVYA